MKLCLMAVGKITAKNLQTGIDDYTERIKRFMPFELRIIPDIRTSKKTTAIAQKETEGAAILSQIQPGDFVILLDERGKELTSRQFAEMIEKKSHEVAKSLVFIIGGPYGFSPDVYARANAMLSLSKMTFPHELIRLFFTEQLYRAMTISHNLPYHHD